jgi:voltage-gated potassium channel
VAERSNELKNTTYEIFVAVLSLLSVANGIAVLVVKSEAADGVLMIMNGLFTVVFLADFVYRLATADSKSRYLLRQYGWADFLACVPAAQLKVLRLFRVVRAVRLMRRVGFTSLRKEYAQNPASSALLSLLLLLFLLLQFGGLAIVTAEHGAPDANIVTGSDAVWYTYVTMTTVGYGDRYPVTGTGRAIGMIIMAAGVGLFGTLTGYLANAFLNPRRKKQSVAAAAGPAATLGEMRKLVEASRQAQEELEARLAELERQLRSGVQAHETTATGSGEAVPAGAAEATASTGTAAGDAS